MIQLEVVTDHATLSAFEQCFFQGPLEGIDLREVDPSDPVLLAADWGAVLLSITSAASLKVFKDFMADFLVSRRCKLTVYAKNGIFITFEGPAKDKQEVLGLIDELTADQSPE